MSSDCGVKNCLLSRIAPRDGEDGTGLHGHCKRVVLVNSTLEVSDHEKVKRAFCIPVDHKDSIDDYEGKESETLFVLPEFDGSEFDHLLSKNARVLGFTALKELIRLGSKIKSLEKPVFCLSMLDMNVCLTGFPCFDQVEEMAGLIFYMGGKVVIEVDSNTTYVVSGDYWNMDMASALEYSVPIVTHEWIIKNWRKCMKIGHLAHMYVDDYTFKPFTYAKVSFVGFPPDEVYSMVKYLEEHGGCHAQPDDTECTHMVLRSCAEATVQALCTNAMVVKVDWFWVSVQQKTVVNPKSYFVDVMEEFQNIFNWI